MSIFKAIKQYGVGGLIDLAKVYAEVASGADLKEVSVSPSKVKKLKLKDQFNQASAYPEIFNKSQFIFYGDTNHTDISIHKYFYSEENVKYMADGGVKHVFPEIEPEYQGLIDKAANGSLSPNQFAMAMLKKAAGGDKNKIKMALSNPATQETIDRLEATAKGVALMKANGMQIHCLDDRSNLDKKDIEQLTRYMGDMKNYIAQNVGLPAILHGRILIKYMIDNVQKMQQMGMTEMPNLIKDRMADDPALAKRMLKAANGEKSATLFGAGHASFANGLFDSIGKDKAIRIDLHSKVDYYADRISPMSKQNGQIEPNFVHIIDEKKLYKFRGFKDLKP